MLNDNVLNIQIVNMSIGTMATAKRSSFLR